MWRLLVQLELLQRSVQRFEQLFEIYTGCDHPGCVYEGTIGMTLVEVDGRLYCDQHDGTPPEIK